MIKLIKNLNQHSRIGVRNERIIFEMPKAIKRGRKNSRNLRTRGTHNSVSSIGRRKSRVRVRVQNEWKHRIIDIIFISPNSNHFDKILESTTLSCLCHHQLPETCRSVASDGKSADPQAALRRSGGSPDSPRSSHTPRTRSSERHSGTPSGSLRDRVMNDSLEQLSLKGQTKLFEQTFD